MNDYLNTLLACTLRPQETIQPRRRGRYEPLNYSRGLAMAPPLDLTGSEAADLVEEEVSRVAPSSPGRTPSAPIGPSAVNSRDASAPKTAFLGAPASPPATGRNLPPIGLEQTPWSVADPVQAGEDASAPRDNHLEQTPWSVAGPVQAGEDASAPRDRRAPDTFNDAPAPPPIQSAGEATTTGMNPSEREPVNLAVDNRRTVVRLQAAVELPVPAEQTVVKPVVSPLSHPERQPAAIAGNEPLTPAIQPRPVSPAQPRLNPVSQPAFGESSNLRAAEAPTIQVTIGRIEVRATPPAAPVPKSRPASPTLSLDDYLRQRNEGRR